LVIRKITEIVGVCLKTARRHRPLQNAYTYETPLCYRLFYTLMYERKRMSKRQNSRIIQNSDLKNA